MTLDKETFRKDLETLINRYSIDNLCETPDFILADMVCDFLAGFADITKRREQWFGRVKLVSSEIRFTENGTPYTTDGNPFGMTVDGKVILDLKENP